MKKKDFLKILKNPGLKILLFAVYPLTLALIAGAVACVVVGYKGVWAYFLYGGSAVMLAYGVYTAISAFYPRLKEKLAERALRHRFTGDFVKDYGFRTFVYACVSFAVNASYALFEGVMGIVYHSVWRGCLAVYYITLTVIRGAVIARERRCRTSGEDEKRTLLRRVSAYGACGISLIVLDAAMCGAVTMMIVADNTVVYPGLTIFFSAAYTFYKIIAAAVNLSKAKKTKDPIVQSLRNINLADALISVAALETAMIASFGGAEELLPLRTVTGFGVCVATVAMGIVMTARARKELASIKAGNGSVKFSSVSEELKYEEYFRKRHCVDVSRHLSDKDDLTLPECAVQADNHDFTNMEKEI